MASNAQHDWIPEKTIKYAGLWVRLAAGIVDIAIYLVPITAILLLLVFQVDFSEEDPRAGMGAGYETLFSVPQLTTAAISIIVTGIMWMFWSGRSPGKKLFGIRIITYPGYGKLSYVQSLSRALILTPLGISGIFLFGIPYIVVGYMLLTSLDRRGFHDMITGTCVAYENSIPGETSDQTPEETTS